MKTDKLPLQVGKDGVVRVANTRITLDVFVAAFENGATAEEIAQQYPSLNLADVYAVIAYYLRQRAAVTEYLRGRQVVAASIRQENEVRFNPRAIRKRLLARRTQ